MIIRHIRQALTMLLLTVGLSSCIFDKAAEEPTPEPVAAAKMLSLNVAIPPMKSTEASGSNDRYEAGVDYENYIDLSDKGLRIFIFDSHNKFVTRLIPLGSINPDNTASSDQYTVTGILPENFPATGDIKVVVLAHWPVYKDDMTPGVTTIDDLCNAEWAEYNRLTDFRLSEENNIPFFGIHTYTGLTFTPGETTSLPGNITLMRAMAKIEVVVDNAAISLRYAKIRGINSIGYCAPAGVYSHTDYDHNGDWNLDYVKALHLPDNTNDFNPGTTEATLYRRNQHTDTQKETWVCYVPEYKNTDYADGTANYKSRLELLFDFQEAGDKPSEVYFVDYDADGKPVQGTDHDINRNNCYRFTVDLSQGNLFIKVRQWDNAYDNDFIFE